MPIHPSSITASGDFGRSCACFHSDFTTGARSSGQSVGYFGGGSRAENAARCEGRLAKVRVMEKVRRLRKGRLTSGTIDASWLSSLGGGAVLALVSVHRNEEVHDGGADAPPGS